MSNLIVLENQSLEAPITQSNAPLLAFLNQYKDSTRATMGRYLSMVINLIDPPIEEIDSAQMQARLLTFDWTQVDVHFCNRILRLSQNRKYSKTTRNNLLLALRGIARQRRILGQISKEQQSDIAEVGSKIKGGKLVKKSKAFAPEDLLKMLTACLSDTNRQLGLRDHALLSLLYGSGLRAAEAISLKEADIDFEALKLIIRGKGDDVRIVYPVAGVIDAVLLWREAFEPNDGILFPAFTPRGEIANERSHISMSYNALRDMVRKRALQASIAPPSPHAFRHSFATETYKKTLDLFGLQHQMGHKSQTTTQVYVDNIQQEEAKRRASESWSLPSKNKEDSPRDQSDSQIP